MSTQVISPRAEAPDATPPPRVKLPPEVPPVSAPKRAGSGSRRKSSRPTSGWNLKGFSLTVGASIGLATGLLSRHLLQWSQLAREVSPLTLGVLGAGTGLAVAFLLSRLMLVAQEGTIRVSLDGRTVEFPLRRRHEVVTRACQYLLGSTLGLGLIALALGYAFSGDIPALGSWRPGWGQDLKAILVAVGASLACLALGEWAFRLTRKEGQTEHGPFLMIPSLLALGASLAGAV